MKRLPSELKKKINKISHAAGVAHGELIRLRLLAEIDRRMNAGERHDAMLAELMAMTMTEAELIASDSGETRQTRPKAI